MGRKKMFWVVLWVVSMSWMGGTNGDGTESKWGTKGDGTKGTKGDGTKGTNGDGTGTKWALLIAASRGFSNYRHQADICHAYHVLKNGGLKEENIIVMMYDDIAFNYENPSQGHIYNRPNGPDVYAGVPKDYTGKDVNVQNIFSILRGDGTYLSGGSGKVLKTGPDDTIFIYLSGHGTYRSIGTIGGRLWRDDFIGELIQKHESNSYKKMVVYIEACYAGSMFETDLINNKNIYVTTASNGQENSYAHYCPHSPNPPPDELRVCIGDLYSISWMEDSESNDRSRRTLQQQYLNVRDRTNKSHVMQYGDTNMEQDFLDTYMGAIPDNSPQLNTTYTSISQDEAHLLYLKLKLDNAPYGSADQHNAQKALEAEIAHRKRDDHNVFLMWKYLFGKETSYSNMLASVSQPAVDEVNCLKMLIKTYEDYCGAFSTYGFKYVTAFGHMCSAGFSNTQMIVAVSRTCPLKN